MGHDAPDNQFPRHIVVDDVTMYWYTGYTIGGKAMQVIVDDEDEDEDEDAASEDEAVQAEPEDTFTEHGGAEDTEARGKEAEQVEGGEGEQTTALTNDQSVSIYYLSHFETKKKKTEKYALETAAKE